MTTSNPWFVYILQCSDLSLYTGISNDLQRRLDEHNHGPRGSRYTRARRPVSLVYLEQAESRAAASQREYAIKQLDRPAKMQVILDSQRQCRRLLKTQGKSAPRLESLRR